MAPTSDDRAMPEGGDFDPPLVCPRDHGPLVLRGAALVCAAGHDYPLIDGVPVLLCEELPATIDVATASLRAARAPRGTAPHAELFVETLGIAEHEKAGVRALADRGGPVDPVVAYMVGATNGILYTPLIGALSRYPIPALRLPAGAGARLLDLGCNWGRWSIAAARAGYRVTGVDPSLGAVLAARRVCRELGVRAAFCVADARALPFAAGAFDQVFSYSVLQHFAPHDLEATLAEVARALRSGGLATIQMANGLGTRSLYHQARRRFRTPAAFDVRYWRPAQLRALFERGIGSAELSVDCYFGLGLQPSDAALARPSARLAIALSERLRQLAQRAPWLGTVADSLYVTARKS